MISEIYSVILKRKTTAIMHEEITSSNKIFVKFFPDFGAKTEAASVELACTGAAHYLLKIVA